MFRISNWTLTKVLRLDSLGALLSAAGLGLGLAQFESVFGMPRGVLWPLTSIALSFSFFALAGSFLSAKAQRSVLLLMILNNSIYSLITLILLGLHWDALSILGLIYFLGEILIIAALVSFEVRILRRVPSKYPEF